MEGYPYFPLFVDLSQKTVVVIGGGRIAKRRIETLTQFSERLTVIAPELHPALVPLERDGRVMVRRKRYDSGDLEGADLVLAATNDTDVNDAVFCDCKALGIPVNVSSDRSKCDFYFPGIVRRAHLVVGVSASGVDHGAARRVREMVGEVLEREIGE